MESRADAGAGLGTSGGLLWSLDGADPAARGRGHRPLPPLKQSMRSAQAVDVAAELQRRREGTGVAATSPLRSVEATSWLGQAAGPGASPRGLDLSPPDAGSGAAAWRPLWAMPPMPRLVKRNGVP